MDLKEKSCVALSNADRIGGDDRPPCIGVKPNALPEVQQPTLAKNSITGVSTSSALTLSDNVKRFNQKHYSDTSFIKHWYAMRTTYSRERKAYDYIVSMGTTAFLPTIYQERTLNGKKQYVEVSRIPNIFFVYGTENEVKEYAYDNVHLPFLRFYYRQRYEGVKIIREPLIVPDDQINSLKILCESEVEDIKIVPEEMVRKFSEGDYVVIVDGDFKGVEGRVARWHGQQRVAIIIDGLCTIATAYVPSAFLEKK